MALSLAQETALVLGAGARAQARKGAHVAVVHGAAAGCTAEDIRIAGATAISLAWDLRVPTMNGKTEARHEAPKKG